MLKLLWFTYFIERALESSEQVSGARGAVVRVVALDAPGRAHRRRHGGAAHERKNEHVHS